MPAFAPVLRPDDEDAGAKSWETDEVPALDGLVVAVVLETKEDVVNE